MRFYVNENCIGCTLCATTCPEVFSMTEGGTAEAIQAEVPHKLEEACTECMVNCPAEAIEQV